jgi:hypothetical protein
MAKETDTDVNKGQEEVPAETHSSGPDNDQLNTREQRADADPALAPEIAAEREEEAREEAEKEAAKQEKAAEKAESEKSGAKKSSK